MSIWLDQNSKVIVQGMTGSEGRKHTARMIAYGTRVVGGVTPGKAGQSVTFEERPVPVFGSVAEAKDATGANVSVIFVPARFTKQAVVEAVDAGIELAVVITEGVPVADTAEFAQPKTGCGAMMVEIRHLGGALGRPSTGGGAMDRIDGEYSLFVVGFPEAAEKMAHAVDVLSDFGRGQTYFNFMPRRTGRETAYPPETIARLADLYEEMDQEGLLDHPHPISPVTEVV